MASLLAISGICLIAGRATAAPAGTPPAISPAAASTTTAPQVGDTLTEIPATWPTPPLATTVAWVDCDTSGSNCTFAGAGSTYTVGSADLGHTIEVQETDTLGSQGTLNSGPTLIVGAPVNTSPPLISGVPKAGQTLTEGSDAWTNNPTSFSYQWLDCDGSGNNCAPVAANGTGKTYVVTAADTGATIRVQEVATNAEGPGGPANSASTETVTAIQTAAALVASPASPITNQTSVVVATIRSNSAAVPPSGTVAFENGTTPINGCSSVGVATFSQSVNVTCSTVFSASASPEHLRAIFSPRAGSGLAGSTSPTINVVIGQASTSTSLDVSSSSVHTGATVNYTATVATSAGSPFQPSGSIRFLDNGKLISSCSQQFLALGSLSAQCSVQYTKPGSHKVTAQYSGDGGFSGSTSAPAPVNVSIRVLGTITSKMLWTFRFTPTLTTVLGMVVHGARTGTKITLICSGHRCPFSSRSLVVAKSTGCPPGSNARCFTQSLRNVNLVPSFGGRALPAGSRLTIEFTRPSWIGKTYVFAIRSGHAPRHQILCLAPGSTRPGVGC